MNKVTLWNKGRIAYGSPKVMGIVNVTPDSFSDGGMYEGKELEHAFRLIDEGADIIDVGGESTRPMYHSVPVDIEMERVIPIVKRLAESGSVPISVDTMKPEVAEAAIDAGADMINDIMGMRDPEMRKIVASAGVVAILMHTTAEDPAKIHVNMLPNDRPPLNTVIQELSDRVFDALDSGIKENSIIIDPGFGFGKTNDQNIDILENLDLLSNRFPVLVGVSRKRFLADAFPTLSKDDASLETARIAVINGADIVRVHDVFNTRRVLGIRG